MTAGRARGTRLGRLIPDPGVCGSPAGRSTTNGSSDRSNVYCKFSQDELKGHPMLKLALYGFSGVGKSTTSTLIGRMCSRRGMTFEVIKIADPLHRLQHDIYALLSRRVPPDRQDQVLLRALADQIRRIEPSFLVGDFLKRVDQSTAAAIINDDLKDVGFDYPRLVQAGFRFARITCEEETRARRLSGRADLTRAPETSRTWGFDRIRPDWEIDNTEDGEDALAGKLSQLLARWLE
jgi:cytidine deaminase